MLASVNPKKLLFFTDVLLPACASLTLLWPYRYIGPSAA